jgi:hypothetical protein
MTIKVIHTYTVDRNSFARFNLDNLGAMKAKIATMYEGGQTHDMDWVALQDAPVFISYRLFVDEVAANEWKDFVLSLPKIPIESIVLTTV